MTERYSFGTQYGQADILFRAVLSVDKLEVDTLRANGTALLDEVKRMLVNGGGSMFSRDPKTILWYYYLTDLGDLGAEDFVYVSRIFREETGEPLYYSDTFGTAIADILYEANVFACVTECYDVKRIKKKQTLQTIICKNKTGLLAICEKLGWLKNTKTRDELIEYSRQQEKTECTAWLLDFKNRTADLPAEREKAERKMLRELNAAPDSVTELKKIWRYEKREDGTLVITGYKGDRAEVIIPEKIGKSTVTAIGEYAFSPNAPRLTEEQVTARCRITGITVPPSVLTIGEYAFGGSGWVKGNFNAFSLLEEVVLPDTLKIFGNKKAAENAPMIFVNCPKLTVKIPHSPYAEMYCKRFNLNYAFKNEDK